MTKWSSLGLVGRAALAILGLARGLARGVAWGLARGLVHWLLLLTCSTFCLHCSTLGLGGWMGLSSLPLLSPTFLALARVARRDWGREGEPGAGDLAGDLGPQGLWLNLAGLWLGLGGGLGSPQEQPGTPKGLYSLGLGAWGSRRTGFLLGACGSRSPAVLLVPKLLGGAVLGRSLLAWRGEGGGVAGLGVRPGLTGPGELGGF